VNADFLEFDADANSFDHAVSWLALFHIPERAAYLEKLRSVLPIGGTLSVEDLYLLKAPDEDEVSDFQHHLHPNSLVDKGEYFASLENAGFEIISQSDMTSDWTDFTGSRLAMFHENKAAYMTVHGDVGYEAIEVFYSKMAGYFERGIVGGTRYSARRVK
jgi:hypothetical protein